MPALHEGSRTEGWCPKGGKWATHHSGRYGEMAGERAAIETAGARAAQPDPEE